MLWLNCAWSVYMISLLPIDHLGPKQSDFTLQFISHSEWLQKASLLFSPLIWWKLTLGEELLRGPKDMVGKGRRSTNGTSRVWNRPNTALRTSPLEKADKTEPPTFLTVTKPDIQKVPKCRRQIKTGEKQEDAGPERNLPGYPINQHIQTTKVVKRWQSKERFKWTISTRCSRGKII